METAFEWDFTIPNDNAPRSAKRFLIKQCSIFIIVCNETEVIITISIINVVALQFWWW